MESLLDEVDTLLTPGLSTDAPDWCSNCQSLKQEIKRLQDEQIQSFTKLKQKIISTDLLIKKYKSKCDDYDVQCKKTEEAIKRADKSQKQCEIMQTQVKAALLDTEPLRETKIRLEAEVRLKNTEIQSLSDRLLAVESARQQYEYLSKNSSRDIEKLEIEKKELQQKIKSLQSGKLTKEAAKEYRNTIANLKKEKAALVKNERKLESKLAAAHTRIEKLSGVIKDRKLSPKRRIRTASGNLSSPLMSPTRSPRIFSPRSHKVSPLRQARLRSSSGSVSDAEKKSDSQTTDIFQPQVNEKLASESSSSSDDTDDDSTSLCSVKWTFSPLTKCLSPLPPSPACFTGRKLERGDKEDVEEDEVSDIADILEQQLLEEETSCEGEETSCEGVEKPYVGEETPCIGEDTLCLEKDAPCQVQDDRIKEEMTENEMDISDEYSVKCIKDKEKGESDSSVNDLKELVDHRETVKVPSKIEIVTEDVTDCDNIKESDKAKFHAVETGDGEQTLKEKLANSIEIISPTAVKKRVAHQVNSIANHHINLDSVKNTTNLKNTASSIQEISESKNAIHDTGSKSVKTPKKSPFRRSARLNSQKESETEDHVSNNLKSSEQISKDGDNKTCKNDVITSLELNKKKELNSKSLPDCNIDMTARSISEDASELQESDNTLDGKRLIKDTAEDSVSSQVIIDSIVSNGPKIGDETNSVSIISSPSEIQSCDNDVKINKQTVENKEAIPVPKPSLQKQQAVKRTDKEISPCIDTKSFSDEKNKSCSKKGTKKFGSDKFINFQKSSLGTLSNEIEDFSYVGDYEVLDRSNKNGTMLSSKVGRMQKKNATRRLRRTCKYRDLDFERNNEKKEIINKLKDEQKLSDIEGVDIEDIDGVDKADENDKDKLVPKCNKTVTCKSELISKESSLDIDSNKDTIGTKCSIKQDDNMKTETRNNNNNICGDVKFSGGDVKVSESEEGNDNSEKLTTNRQMSTGFTVNTPSIERASSTESNVSFGTSPSILFSFESSPCGTIVEEESDGTLRNDNNEIKTLSKVNSNCNFIFGAEDLLCCEQKSSHVLQNSENAQNNDSVCDNNVSSENTGKSLTVDRTVNKYTGSSLCTVGQDDEYSKPGCSYQYPESSREKITNYSASDRETSASRLPFVSDTMLHDDSSSRSSIQSITSIERASPVSPLSLSPFDFLNPISPLPPSPIKEIDRVSPLSPEHMNDEQKGEVDNESELADDNKKDILGLDERVQVENIGEEISVKNLTAVNVSENVNDNNLVNSEEKKIQKQPESSNSDTIKSTKNLERVEKVLDRLASVKNEQIPSGTLETEACSGDASLKLFSIPQMISPVKTPKSRARIKTEQIKSSKDVTKLITGRDQVDTSPVIEGDKMDKCTIEGPKQFVTKAPVTAISVKPQLTGSRACVDKAKIDMCIRKSSRTALKRVSAAGKLDSVKVKTDSSDNVKVGDETPTCLSGSDVSSLKCESHMNAEKFIKLDKVTKKSEELPVNNADLFKAESDISAVVDIDEKGDNKVIEECTHGQDNLAFKRKARVAHKPNTLHPVKLQKKIQIIEAPVLPPVTAGRKRKSLDKNKEHHENKKPKEESEKSQKTTSSDKTISQETKKKMQAFLKSSETAECFVSKFSTQPCDDSVKSDLLGICLECLGRVQTDTLDVVHHICQSSQYLNISCQLPFISDVEKKAVELIQYIVTELHCDCMEVMRKIWDVVFSRDVSTNMFGKMAQCRVFVALCSMEGDVEQARTFFYHIVTCGHLNYLQFVVSVVSVWPEILRKDPTDRPDKVVIHGMTLVLEHVVTKLILSQLTEANKKILLILQKLCGWSGTAGNANSILKLLCNRMLSLFEVADTDKSGVLELRLAIELLCKSQTWPWFKEQFIMRTGLQTAYNKYLAERILKPVPPEYVCEMLKLTSRGLFTFSNVVKAKEYQQIIRNWLLPLLKHKQDNLKVQESCVETMIELSPLYPDILSSIHSWFVEKNDVSKELGTRLEYLRIQYKQKTGLQCKPFVKI